MKTATTLQQSPGGLFMVGLPGLELDDSTRELIKRGRVNDFIFFKRNLANPAQITRLCADLALTCQAAGLAPPLIAIDQEGGTVSRLPPPFTQFPDARDLASAPEPELALVSYARICASELRKVGINVNLAPVLDLCPAAQGFYMERRVLGAEQAVVSRLGCLVIKTMQENGLAACAKHFPGLGSARLDPHQEISAINRTQEELWQDDLPPFQAAAKLGVAAIMTSHTIYPAFDPSHPATLSPLILTNLLRQSLNFQGVIVSDDLEMGAIAKHYTVAEAALISFLAGADQMLICRDHAKVRAALARFTKALAAGEISLERLRSSLDRIAALRRRFTASG